MGVVPSPPVAVGGKFIVVEIIAVDVDILKDFAVCHVEAQFVDHRRVSEEVFLADSPSEAAHRRETVAVAGSEFCRVVDGAVEFGIVAAVVVVGGTQSQRSVGGAVVLAGDGALVAVGYEVGFDTVNVVEAVLIVELAGEHEGLAFGRIADVLHTAAEVVAEFGDVCDHVLAVVVRPRGLICGIGVVDRSGVAGVVVDSTAGHEAQTGQEFVETQTDTGIELQLTAGPLGVAAYIHCGEGVGLVQLCAAEQISAVDDITRVVHQNPRVFIAFLDGIQGDERYQRSGTGNGRTHCGRFAPVVGQIAAVVVEGSAGVNPAGHPVVEAQIDVAAHIESGGAVVLAFAEVEDIVAVIETYQRIESGEFAAAGELCLAFVAPRVIAQIIVGEEVDVGIAPGILA